MRPITLFLILVIFSFSATAQNNQQQLFRNDSSGIVLILNDEIIGSIDLLKTVPPKQIHGLEIHREGQLSSKENLFHGNNSKSGLMVAKTDFNFETKTQEELNVFFGLSPDNDLYINGFLLENKQYKISSDSIAKIEIIEPDHVFLDKHILNITLK